MEPQAQDTSLSPKQQVVERVRAATNVLVTVRSNPTVDELAATIGLTLMLNKLGKHATAVFSGQVPSTLEFLRPEETIETNTDSLRDFIVSLDKSKADKLRYKVEENVVKIFITPYRTSLSENDLEFSQGDYNVDVVIALGVTQREELDQAIVSHGRILHDAAVVTVTAGQRESTLGMVNWQEPAASSLCEMLVSISEALQGGIIDEQMATALLTGIVAETERFSNTKTSPKVMTMAAQLMAAGANQQLIANELDKGKPQAGEDAAASAGNQPVTQAQPAAVTDAEDGTLSIEHTAAEEPESEKGPSLEPIEPAVPVVSGQEPPADKAASTEERKTAEQPLPAEPFLPPLPPAEAGEGFNPLVPATTEPPSQSPAEPPAELPPLELPSLDDLPKPEPEHHPEGQIHIDEEGNLLRKTPSPKHKIIQPLSGDTDSPAKDSVPSFLPPSPDASAETMFDPLQAPAPASLPSVPSSAEPVPAGPARASGTVPIQPAPATEAAFQPARVQPTTGLPPVPPAPSADTTTLLDLEKSVNAHVDAAGMTADSARDAVSQALNQTPFDPASQPRTDLNAMPLGGLPPQQNLPPAGQPPLPPQPDQAQTEAGSLPPPPVPPPFNFPQ